MILIYCYTIDVDSNSIRSFLIDKKIGLLLRTFATKESDVDILIEFKGGYETFDNYMELKFFLEGLFGRKVDLVTIDALRPQLKQDILKEVSYA